jgi:hypothetical protein
MSSSEPVRLQRPWRCVIGKPESRWTSSIRVPSRRHLPAARVRLEEGLDGGGKIIDWNGRMQEHGIRAAQVQVECCQLMQFKHSLIGSVPRSTWAERVNQALRHHWPEYLMEAAQKGWGMPVRRLGTKSDKLFADHQAVTPSSRSTPAMPIRTVS